MIRTCTIQIDKANVAVPLFAATYRLDVFEAASATPLTSVDIGSINICPLVVAVDPKQPKIFAAPADAPIARTVLPLVKG